MKKLIVACLILVSMVSTAVAWPPTRCDELYQLMTMVTQQRNQAVAQKAAALAAKQNAITQRDQAITARTQWQVNAEVNADWLDENDPGHLDVYTFDSCRQRASAIRTMLMTSPPGSFTPEQQALLEQTANRYDLCADALQWVMGYTQAIQTLEAQITMFQGQADMWQTQIDGLNAQWIIYNDEYVSLGC